MKLTAKQYTPEMLAMVLTEHEPISAAPTSLDEHQYAREKHRVYKAINAAGQVFLIDNPATRIYEEALRMDRIVYRSRPQPMGHISDLMAGTTETPKKRSGAMF